MPLPCMLPSVRSPATVCLSGLQADRGAAGLGGDAHRRSHGSRLLPPRLLLFSPRDLPPPL
eukprot:777100-Rhodomonas_salina.1